MVDFIMDFMVILVSWVLCVHLAPYKIHHISSLSFIITVTTGSGY